MSSTNLWRIWLSIAVIVSGLLFPGCLGLSGHKRQPDTDDKPNDCSGVSCWEPPANTCAENDELQVFAPSGYCSGGDCFYATGQMPCHSGLCDDGVCVSTPCQGITCIDPPMAFCTDADRTIYAPSGYCSGGVCEYAWRTNPCEYSCESGACEDSPCAEVFCWKQPAPYCDDEANLVVFEPIGRCALVVGRAECRYESQTIVCPLGCKAGRCLENPCAGVICDRPPARYCDGAVLVLFQPDGVCDENGFCRYAEQRHECIDPCVDAHCGEDDSCTWVSCDKPPASHCHDLSTLRVYAREGQCEDGFCSYLSSDKDCPKGCEEGRCVGAPCLGVICDLPPASYCQSNTVLVEYASPGACHPEDGSCVYETQASTCALECEAGECVQDTEEISKDITQFAILGVDGKIGTNTIVLTLPLGTDLTSLTPTIGHTGAGISPQSGVATDFSTPVEYTVTARDNSTKVYTATVRVAEWQEQAIPAEYPKMNRIYRIVVSPDGNKIVLVAHESSYLTQGYIFTVSENGTWIRHTSAGRKYWTGLAASADMTRIVGVVNLAYISTSEDSGASWTERASSGMRLWTAIAASSPDGTKLAATVNLGYIYTSEDGGKSWTQHASSGSRFWTAISSSADGTKLAATVQGGYIFTSEDRGATWIEQTASGFSGWRDIASSADGSKLVAVIDGGNIYTSEDGGITWTARAAKRPWKAVASSSDGTRLIAAADKGYIYTSKDSGVTWTPHTALGSKQWEDVACSSNGVTLVAGANGWRNVYIAK